MQNNKSWISQISCQDMQNLYYMQNPQNACYLQGANDLSLTAQQYNLVGVTRPIPAEAESSF